MLAIDTHQYIKKLKEKGVSEEVAEVHAEALNEIATTGLATKGDITLVRSELATVKSELKEDIAEVRRELAETKNELIKRMIGLMFPQTALILTIVKFWN